MSTSLNGIVYLGIVIPIPYCIYSDFHILPTLWNITMYIVISVPTNIHRDCYIICGIASAGRYVTTAPSLICINWLVVVTPRVKSTCRE